MTEEGAPEGDRDADSGVAGAETAESRAAGTDDGDLDIPLPWNTTARDESGGDADASETATDEDAADGATTPDPESEPERFEDLRFVGPKSAAVLRDSEISLSDFREKRVTYRELKAVGVNPGVAAKIRREHSLSWSLDGDGTDLDRRSAQIRGLDDDERAWIAASAGGADAAAETDGSGDATAAEAAWRERTDAADSVGVRGEATGTEAGTEAGTDAPSDRRSDAPETPGEAAWQAAAGVGEETDPGDETDPDEDLLRDGESAWRRQSAPTPLTALEDFDEEVAATLHRAGIGSVRRLATADPESVADALELDVARVESWCRRARDHESR
ncbi:MAG: helix-hairpin-helix domain-containing protein [Haloquadratum sp.]